MHMYFLQISACIPTYTIYILQSFNIAIHYKLVFVSFFFAAILGSCIATIVPLQGTYFVHSKTFCFILGYLYVHIFELLVAEYHVSRLTVPTQNYPAYFISRHKVTKTTVNARMMLHIT